VAGILGFAQDGGPPDSAPDAAARVVDVAPTVLYALGVPLSRELPGQPLRQLFGGAALNASRERFVSTYGRPFTRPAARRGQPLDQEMIDRLRSLGYVK
jgi:arylsulfatase A-like enzyme